MCSTLLSNTFFNTASTSCQLSLLSLTVWSGLLLCMCVCADTYLNARDWLMSAFDLSEDQALTLMTVACDFQVGLLLPGKHCQLACIAVAG